MKIFCPVKFLRSIMMRLKLLLRCGVINVSPKVEFNEPNKRFRVEDKFAVLLGELPDDSCQSKVLGHSRRILSNCPITQGLPSISLSMSAGQSASGSRYRDRPQPQHHAPSFRPLIGCGGRRQGPMGGQDRGEAAVAWSVAASWDHPMVAAGGRQSLVGLQGP